MENPKTQSQRLERMRLAEPGKTHGLTGSGARYPWQDSVGWVFWQFGRQTECFLLSEPSPLAGYPDALLTLHLLLNEMWLPLQLGHFSCVWPQGEPCFVMHAATLRLWVLLG